MSEEKITLTKRIIPCLDLKDGRVVKGVKFEGLRDAGDPVECAKAYNDQGADEICSRHNRDAGTPTHNI